MGRRLNLSLLVATLTLFNTPSVAHAAPSGVTYQGRILKPDGTPLSGSNVQFRIQIRAPDANSCLLYEELQSQNLSASRGSFAITINDGTGVRQDATGLGLDRIFANRGTFDLDPATCAAGNSFVPGTSDGRVLQVYFKDETMAAWEPMPPQKINYVPFAFETKQIAGFTASNLLRFAESDGTLVSTSPLNNAQYTELLALLNGSSTTFERAGRLGGVSLPALGVAQAGQVLSWNGTAWETAANGASTPPSQWGNQAGGAVSYTGGRVGIGTTAPAYALDVSGVINATGFKINGVDLATGGGVPGGANKQIQFNNSGVFGGSANLTYDSTNSWLGINATPVAPLTVSPFGGASQAAKFKGNSNWKDVGIQFESYDGSGRIYLDFSRPGNSSHQIGIDSGDNFYFGLGNNINSVHTDVINMAPSGNVAIGKGVVAPNGKLDVNGSIVMSGSTSGYSGLKVADAAGSTVWQLPVADGTSGQALVTNASGVLSWSSMASANYWTKAVSDLSYTAGNVAIGAASASAKLDVAGNARFTGAVQMESSASVGAAIDANSRFYVYDNPWAQTGDYHLTQNYWIYNGTANNNGLVSGAYNHAFLSRTGTNHYLFGTRNQLEILNSLGNTDWIAASTIGINNSSSNTIGEITAMHGFINQTGTGTANVVRGLAVGINQNAGTITAGYGVYIDSIAGSTNYGVYQASAANQNFFAGKVGIGTSTPVVNLQVESDFGTSFIVQNNNPTSNSHSNIQVRNYRGWQGGGDPRIVSYAARGWPASPSNVIAGMTLMSLQGNGFAEAGYGAERTGGSIDMVAAGDWGNSTIPTDMIFKTGTTGDWNAHEGMRLTSTGTVGIGTTAPSEKLEVSGNVKATSFIQSSDARLKQNIVATPGLEIIQKLTGVQWQWRMDGHSDGHFGGQSNGQTDAGVIAQQLEKVMPYAVVTDVKSGYKAVKYNALFAPLIQSTKELQAQNTALKNENEALKARLDSVEERLKAIEARLLTLPAK